MSNADVPAIDQEAYAALEDIADGDQEFMSELLNQYLADANTLVSSMISANDTENTEDLERAAHTLKSASANVGAMHLSQLCEKLQRLGRAGNLEGCGSLVTAATDAYDQVKVELKQRLEKLA